MCKTFPSSHRLLKSQEFDAVFENRDFSVSNKSFLFLATRNDLGFNRLGLIVGKKSLPRAVDRNGIKRQLREAFRQLESMSLDIVALVRPGIRQEDYPRLVIDKLFDDLSKRVHS